MLQSLTGNREDYQLIQVFTVSHFGGREVPEIFVKCIDSTLLLT